MRSLVFLFLLVWVLMITAGRRTDRVTNRGRMSERKRRERERERERKTEIERERERDRN